MPVSIARWVLYGGFVYGVSVKSVRLFSWYKNWYLGGLGIFLEWYGIYTHLEIFYAHVKAQPAKKKLRVGSPKSCFA